MIDLKKQTKTPMKKDELLRELRAIGDDLADQARKGPSEYPAAKYEYEAVRFVIKNIDKLYHEEV